MQYTETGIENGIVELQLVGSFLTSWRGSAPAGERVPGKPLSVRYYDDIHG
jgi:hypothetical protein